MARRKRERISGERWSEDAMSVWTGMADWRAAHPTATFSEIEAALDERLNQVRARGLADLALASTAADGTARTTDLSYFSRRAEHTAFRRLALVETYRRGVGTALEVVAVLDGADWLQRLVDVHRPDAIRILDFPHAVEYLAQAASRAASTVPVASSPTATSPTTPPTPKTVSDGRPTNAHPWNQRFLPHRLAQPAEN